MVYVRNMDKEFADFMQQYESAGGNPCAGVSILFGMTAIITAIVFLGTGYHTHNNYTSRGGNPLTDWNYLGDACKLQDIYYDVYEIEERRVLEGEDSSNHQRQRFLPPSPPEPRCYESWDMTFQVSNIASNHTYMNHHKRRVCGKACEKCKSSSFWGEDTDKVTYGVKLQPGKVIECWEKSDQSAYLDVEIWDCYSCDCHYKIRDPTVIFNENKEYMRSQRHIVVGWVLLGCGLALCLLAIGIESVREYGKSQSHVSKKNEQ